MYHITGAIGELIHFLEEHATGENRAHINHLIDSIRQVRNMRGLYNLLQGLRPLIDGHSSGILIGVLEIITRYSEYREHQELHHALDRLVAMTALEMQVQIEHTRVVNANLLLNHAIANRIGVSIPDESKDAIESASHILVTLPPPNLQLIIRARHFADRVLEEQEHHANHRSSINHLLDHVGDDVQYQNRLIEFLAYRPRVDAKQVPEMRLHGTINYAQIKMRYGGRLIENMMKSLVSKFSENGGEKLVKGEYFSDNEEVPIIDSFLFGGLANSLGNSANELADCIQRIAAENNHSVFVNAFSGATLLQDYYNNGAKIDLEATWNRANWDHFPHGQPRLEPNVSKVIRLRALVEFCDQTAPRICFPRNVPRETANGVADVAKGLGKLGIGFFNAVTHPQETGAAIQNLSNRMSHQEERQELWRAMRSGIRGTLSAMWQHPTRAISSTATSVALSYAVAKGINRMFPDKPIYSPPISGEEEEGVVFMARNMSLTSTKIGGTVLGAETLMQNRSQGLSSEYANPLGSDIEQQIDESSYPVVTTDSLTQLKEQIGGAKNMMEFYEIFMNWHNMLASSITNEANIRVLMR